VSQPPPSVKAHLGPVQLPPVRVSLVFVAPFSCLHGSAHGYVLLLHSHLDVSHTSVHLFVISAIACPGSHSVLQLCCAVAPLVFSG
jgi:hypothetical protein